MISAMPAVALRRDRKKALALARNPPSHHSSNSSLAGRNRSYRGGRPSISTISGHPRAFHPRRRFDTELDRQRRRFLIYMGTMLLISGLFLVFIGVGAAVPTAQTVGLLLIGVGAVLCIIKVFCSEAHATEVPRRVVVREVDVEESSSGGDDEDEKAVTAPLADIAEYGEVPTAEPPSSDNQTPVSPPNSIPETQVLIGNDSGGRY